MVVRGGDFLQLCIIDYCTANPDDLQRYGDIGVMLQDQAFYAQCLDAHHDRPKNGRKEKTYPLVKKNLEVTKLLLYLMNIYGEKNFLVTCGKKHEYLGMDLDYSEEGVFKVSMVPYIDKIHEDFPEAIEKSAPTPHTDYLFKVREMKRRQSTSLRSKP